MLSPNTILQNRYRIIRQLGEGGGGTVYEAIDQRVSAIVALKETKAGTDADSRRAFEREAALLANLRHQSLPKVMDYFAEVGGEFLVMEFIAGYDIAEMLEFRGGPFELHQVLHWADELLKVLEYLHGRRPPILHRDIKPSNLKTTRRGEIFLLDFGLAKGAAGQMPTLITSRSVRGFTPTYSSLEQIMGQGTDPRSDLYSLGATLYNLLTGIYPIDAPTRDEHVEDGKPDPLEPIDHLNPQVPSEIAAIIQQAMAIRRKQRLASAAEMRRALGQAVTELRRREEEEEKRRQESEQQREEEVRQRAAEEAARLAAIELQREKEQHRRQEEARRVEEERLRRAAEEEERQRREAEEAKRRAEEEAARKLAAEREAAHRRAEEERARIEEETRLKAEEEARLREEDALRLRAEEEQRRKEEARILHEAEEAERRLAAERAGQSPQNAYPVNVPQTIATPPHPATKSQESAPSGTSPEKALKTTPSKSPMRAKQPAEVRPIPAVVSVKARKALIAAIAFVALVVGVIGGVGLLYRRDGEEKMTNTNQAVTGQQQGQTVNIPTAPPNMAYVPGGDFMMGRDDGDEYERPAHKVMVKPFYIDLYEVTREEYKKCVDEGKCQPPPGWAVNSYRSGTGKLPVTGVTWDEANIYAKWAGKRLPTEEEWEFAARGTDGHLYPWGNVWKAGLANTGQGKASSQEGALRMAEVGTYKGQSPYGAYDMIGNAWEWTASDLTPYPGGTLPSRLKSLRSLKVIRGGSWSSENEQATTTFRRGYRARGEINGYSYTGFRLVKDVPSAPNVP